MTYCQQKCTNNFLRWSNCQRQRQTNRSLIAFKCRLLTKNKLLTDDALLDQQDNTEDQSDETAPAEISTQQIDYVNSETHPRQPGPEEPSDGLQDLTRLNTRLWYQSWHSCTCSHHSAKCRISKYTCCNQTSRHSRNLIHLH
mmetsp:Transcript_24691/g.37521  ORF Transcript_24691/g.37521 Transcript_24691/m.37521 type:complete len:142 (-) Transcript_24691:673-1098(-)